MLPEISTVASVSTAVAVTETLVVLGATSTLPSTRTVFPLTIMLSRLVLLESGVR